MAQHRTSGRPLSKGLAWSAGLCLLLGAVILASAAIGSVRIHPLTVAQAAANAVSVPSSIGITAGEATLAGYSVRYPAVSMGYVSPFEFSVPETAATIVVDVRLPRIALAAAVGIALAAAGTVMQGFFRNPLAEPSIIGVSSGAAVGAVAAIAVPAFVPLGLRPTAFLTALATAFGVYALATEHGRTPVATLLLAGIAVQTFLGAMISYLLLHSGESLEQAVYWLMGHLHASTWGEVRFALPIAIFGTVVLGMYSQDLNVLLLGEEEAHNLGVEVERTKRVLLAIASVVTAAGVAVAGVIGFVGLVVPHVMRLLVGPDHRILLPTSAIAGGAFLVAADTLARSGPAEVPVGIVTAAVGAPFFLYLLRKEEVHGL